MGAVTNGKTHFEWLGVNSEYSELQVTSVYVKSKIKNCDRLSHAAPTSMKAKTHREVIFF